jgi:hypothetical protein
MTDYSKSVRPIEAKSAKHYVRRFREAFEQAHVSIENVESVLAGKKSISFTAVLPLYGPPAMHTEGNPYGYIRRKDGQHVSVDLSVKDSGKALSVWMQHLAPSKS